MSRILFFAYVSNDKNILFKLNYQIFVFRHFFFSTRFVLLKIMARRNFKVIGKSSSGYYTLPERGPGTYAKFRSVLIFLY